MNSTNLFPHRGKLQVFMHEEKWPGDVFKVPGDPLDDVADDARYGIYTFITTTEKPRELVIADSIRYLAEQGDLTSALIRGQQMLAESQVQLGVISEAAGDLAAALESYRKESAIFESLWSADPTNAKMRRDLAISYGDVGRMLQATGNLARAMQNYRKALQIYEELANVDTSNRGAQRDLAVDYENVGDQLMRINNLSAAQEYYRKALAIRERISAADPQNAELRNFLSADYARIGNVLARRRLLKRLQGHERYVKLFVIQGIS